MKTNLRWKNKLLKSNRKTGASVTYYVRKNKVFVRIDLVSGYFCVEGSKQTYDDLFAFRGLDEQYLNISS